jgi:hypothetical protein
MPPASKTRHPGRSEAESRDPEAFEMADSRFRGCKEIDDRLDQRRVSFETAAEPVLGRRDAWTRGQLPQSL